MDTCISHKAFSFLSSLHKTYFPIRLLQTSLPDRKLSDILRSKCNFSAWNNLPAVVKSPCTVSSFKDQLLYYGISLFSLALMLTVITCHHYSYREKKNWPKMMAWLIFKSIAIIIHAEKKETGQRAIGTVHWLYF